MSKALMLRELLERPGVIVVPGVYDCIGAKLTEKLGFSCVFTSGFGISGSTLGRPDLGFLTATETLWSVARIADSVEIPLVADLDTGYGGPLNVERTVAEVVKAGVAGVILEDQVWPKRCGHFEGKRVIPAEEHIEKIRAAREAGHESALVIIARTDTLTPLGMEEALRRGRAYVEAGADVLFVEAPRSVDELSQIAEAFPHTHLFANMVEGGKTPLLGAQRLEELGFKIVIYPVSGLFAAVRAIESCLAFLKSRGTTEGFEHMSSFTQFEELMGMEGYIELEKKFSEGGE